MLELISGILFSLSANIDNIPIGLSYGVKKIHISFFRNIIICIITSIITFLSMFIGQNISNFFDMRLTNIIGSIFLIFLGIYPILKNIFIKNKNIRLNNNKKYSLIQKNICIKELLLIIFTLSLNNIAAGFAASIAGINIWYTTISTFLFGSIFLYIGNNFGKRINNNLIQKYSELISSLILILIGIMEVFI